MTDRSTLSLALTSRRVTRHFLAEKFSGIRFVSRTCRRDKSDKYQSFDNTFVFHVLPHLPALNTPPCSVVCCPVLSNICKFWGFLSPVLFSFSLAWPAGFCWANARIKFAGVFSDHLQLVKAFTTLSGKDGPILRGVTNQ